MPVLCLLVALASGAVCAAADDGGGEQPTAAETAASGAQAPFRGEVEPRARTTVQVAARGQATSLLVAEGSVWVAAYEDAGSKVFRVDPDTSEVVASIPVDAVPMWEVGGDGMAVGAGAVWVTGGTETGAVLQRIDPSRNEVVATIPLSGGSGADVAVGETGVWVSVFGRGPRIRVIRVDPATSRVVATIPVKGDWIREIFSIDGTVLVRGLLGEESTLTATTLTVIDSEENRVVANARMDEPHGPVAEENGVIWVGAGRKLLRIDPQTGRPLGDPIFVGKAVSFTSISGGEGGIWFIGYEPDDESARASLHRVNQVRREIDVSVALPKAPTAMAVGQGSIWLVNYEGSLTRIDLR